MTSIFNPAGNVKKWTLGALQKTGDLTNESLAGFEPYSAGGAAGYGALLDAYGLNGQGGYQNALSRFQTSPGYDFQLQQGLKGIQGSAAARGGLASGATLKALEGYGQNLANQEWGNYLSGLGGLSSMGMQSEGQQANIRNQEANRIYQGYTGIGGAQAGQAAGYLGAAGQIAGSLLGNAFGGGGGGGSSGGLGSLMKLFA